MPDEKAWVIRDVPEKTRRKVKKFAGEWGVTIAEALERLVDSGEKIESVQVADLQMFNFNNPEQMAALADLVAEAMERRQRGE